MKFNIVHIGKLNHDTFIDCLFLSYILLQSHLMLAEDGSGKGAGLVSAIAQRINSRNECTANGYHQNGKLSNGLIKEITVPEHFTNGNHNGITNGTNGRS